MSHATKAPAAPSKTSPQTLEDFKKLVRKAIFLTPDEEKYFNAIPDDNWLRIFEVNFNGNYAYADRVILKKFKEIKATDMPRVLRESQKITNIDKASEMARSAIEAREPVFFITDIDNDGSFSQSIINEFLKAWPQAASCSHVEYTQTVNGNAARGITVDHVAKLVEMKGIDTDKPFLLVTADNGINSRDEVDKIRARYPAAKIIVTDHHNPDEGMVVKEDSNTLIFNPQYKPASEFFQRFNISGAATVGVLLRRVLEKALPASDLEQAAGCLERMTSLSRAANLLDYVKTDPMDKPEKDYVVTKFLQLQGLMNTTNSLSKIILEGIPEPLIAKLAADIPELDAEALRREGQNIQAQNFTARMLLGLQRRHSDDKEVSGDDFGRLFAQAMADESNYQGLEKEVNRNFIEQLRPVIFSLSVDEDKSAFMEKLGEAMVACYESIRASEKAIATELRKGDAMKKAKLPNSAIGYADNSVVKTFNRKLLGKVYNDENPGFLAIIDSNGGARATGSFRSLYDISDILPEQDRVNLEFELGVRILTPGHERAAGFIIESCNPEADPITPEKIQKINEFIDQKIGALRQTQAASGSTHLLTDLSAISLIDRINQAVRGSISHFERIAPLLKIEKDTIWTDSYSTRQYTMEQIAKEKKYGYVPIITDFHGGTIIVPVELIRRIVDNGFKDYISVNYMDGGVFMAERVVSPEAAPKIIDLRGSDAKGALIDSVFSTDFKDKNLVKLDREQIKDNPFFKYNAFRKQDFNLFERMVIGIIDNQKVNGQPIDTLAVFDVEANGFGNGKLMNIGAMNYSIKPGSGFECDIQGFQDRLFQNQRGAEFLLTPEQAAALVPVPASRKMELPLERRKMLLMKRFADPGSSMTYDMYYDYPDSARDDEATPGLGKIGYVTNHAIIDGKVVCNREIQAEMFAYLVKEGDFKVPQEMTNLTGITQAHLDAHGKPTAQVDQEIASYYKGKSVLFGAHNTPYDARILRANAPLTYEVLRSNAIYDSALFCRQDKLAYDAVDLTRFVGVKDMPENIHFYDNMHSDFSLIDFLMEQDDGYYPDRTGRYLLGRENGQYVLIDKEKHDQIKIELTPPEDNDNTPADYAQSVMISSREPIEIPNISVKYSVEKLSEQWMTHALLLDDEPFDIQHVDLSQTQYAKLAAFESQLIFYQDNYLFDAKPSDNIDNICKAAFIGVDTGMDSDEFRELLAQFTEDFLRLNRDIQQKFTDSWMVKKVLTTLDPHAKEERSNDYVDLINFQTQIPKADIRKILYKARVFKDKYGLDHLLQHEGHVNGPWEGDAKGDVAFEDKLTLTLLGRRMYNPYSRDISAAIDSFGSYACKAKLAFDLAHHLSDGSAHDSYSYRQGLLYDRERMTPMIKGIQAKEADLAKLESTQVVKFKLDNDLLPDETNVRAIVRKGVSLTREDIERDAEMLGFIVVNEAAKNSADNIADGATINAFTKLTEANDKISLAYKEKLSERYRYVEISKREAQLKKLLGTCMKIATGEKSKMPKASDFKDVSMADIGIVETIFDGQVGMRPCDPGCVADAKRLLGELRVKREPSNLENALAQGDSGTFATFKDIQDPWFLKEVKINRRDPIHALLFKHPQFRMGNALLTEKIEEAQSAAPAPRGRKMGA